MNIPYPCLLRTSPVPSSALPVARVESGRLPEVRLLPAALPCGRRPDRLGTRPESHIRASGRADDQEKGGSKSFGYLPAPAVARVRVPAARLWRAKLSGRAPVMIRSAHPYPPSSPHPSSDRSDLWRPGVLSPTTRRGRDQADSGSERRPPARRRPESTRRGTAGGSAMQAATTRITVPSARTTEAVTWPVEPRTPGVALLSRTSLGVPEPPRRTGERDTPSPGDFYLQNSEMTTLPGELQKCPFREKGCDAEHDKYPEQNPDERTDVIVVSSSAETNDQGDGGSKAGTGGREAEPAEIVTPIQVTHRLSNYDQPGQDPGTDKHPPWRLLIEAQRSRPA